MGAQSKTHPRSAKARDRQATALKLRASGATYAAIGEHLGVSAVAAYKMVKLAIDEIPAEAVADLRAVELGRLDRLTAAVWRNATDGSIKHIDTVVKLMERRAKLTGLDAPVLTDDVSDWTDEELLDYATTGKRPTRRSRGARTEEARAIQNDTRPVSDSAVADANPTAQP
jgi:hypothetical protein